MLETPISPIRNADVRDRRRFVIRSVLTVCVLLIVAVCEVTCLNIIEIRHVRPDLILVLLVYIAVYHGFGPAFGVATVGGILQDVLGKGLIGANVFSKVLVAILFVYIGSRVVTDRPAVKVALMMAATLVCTGILYSLFALAGFHYRAGFYLTRIAVPSAFYNSLVMPPVWWAARKCIYWTERQILRGDTSR